MKLGVHWSLWVWVLPTAVGIFFALQWYPAVYLPDGSIVPIGPDSFYHAVRIIEAVDGPLIQFDPRMHVPDGSWVSWPWGYDWLSARVLAAVLTVTGAQEPMLVLVHFPLIGLVINTALLLAICRSLDLSRVAILLAMLAYASLPITQELHAVGAIDHHYVEHFFVLMSLLLLLRWADRPDGRLEAGALGVCLGIAPAAHVSLFVLQFPILAFIFFLWVRGDASRFSRSSVVFSAALLFSTLMILLPSGPFRDGQFLLYTLSSFHLLVATISAGALLFLAKCRYSTRHLIWLGVVILGGLLVSRMEVQTGLNFLGANIRGLEYIQETGGLLRDSLEGVNPMRWVSMYSGLLWLSPLLVVWSVFGLLKSRQLKLVAYHVFALIGLGLLFAQYRLHYFGSFALVLGPLLAFEGWRSEARRAPGFILIPAVVICCLVFPQAVAMVGMRVQAGGEFYYTYTRPLFADLERECLTRPGTVFADDILGHYIRFHSECAVFTNMFMISPLHEAKGLESDYRMSLSSREFLAEKTGADFVMLVRRDDFTQESPSEFVNMVNVGLRRELIWGTDDLPGEFELVRRLMLDKGNGKLEPIAALYRINRSPPARGADQIP